MSAPTKSPPPATRRAGHSADLHIVAWAKTKESCIAEAVQALCGSLVRARIFPATSLSTFLVRGPTDEELLVHAMETVIAGMRKRNEIPLAIEAVPDPAGLRLRCDVADIGSILPTGALPKAVSQRRPRCEAVPGGWRCAVRIDM
ncbi:archease [Amycolatopsis sp. GM8]|uniref:archease n=1 Tax=Amycolatopsis sp. GM8 TaxID=2896530 RepID=UPI001F3322DA|nr:archease [Amycolatopsis sp. GM8]